MTYSVAGMKAATTYYWKVAATDGKGLGTESEIFRFTTQ